jgi:hypothetical protein
LKFVEAYIDEKPDEKETKTDATVKEFNEEIELSVSASVKEEVEEEKLKEETVEVVETFNNENDEVLAEEIDLVVENTDKEETIHVDEQQSTESNNTKESLIKDDIQDQSSLHFTLEEEFKDAISADVATDLFERATKENPIIEERAEVKQKSLNDTLFSNKLQVGLNDRIAFVKYLFDGSQEDFNRVLSQLNSFKTEDEAKTFIQEFVKPDYNWSSNLEYEERLINLVERKFS